MLPFVLLGLYQIRSSAGVISCTQSALVALIKSEQKIKANAAINNDAETDALIAAAESIKDNADAVLARSEVAELV